MSRVLKEENIRNIIYGATLMGGGGGGSMSAGINIFENYKKAHPTEKIEIELISPDEMEDNTYAAVTAGMGAPTALPDDFTPWILNAYNLYAYINAYQNKTVQYSMAVELGGFNTFVPMLISLEKKIPFLDMDGAARAVPALPTLLFNVNGYDTFPLALADHIPDADYYNMATLDFPQDAKNAAFGEDFARDIITKEMKQAAGLSGWLTAKEDFSSKKLPYGSITVSEKIGEVLRNAAAEEVYKKLNEAAIVQCKDMGEFTVTNGQSDMALGFDKGWIAFESVSENLKVKIDFQNENLVLYAGPKTTDQLNPMVTAPEIICAFEATDSGNVPLTNADFFDKDGKIILGRRIFLGVIKVNDVWWYAGYDRVNEIWSEYFKNVGYNGKILPF